MKFIFFPIAIIALQQSTKATAATNWFVPTGGSATIDCPSSGAQCCLPEGQQWENVNAGADAITIFGSSDSCYGGSGTAFSGCGTEPACVFSCEDACVVEGGDPSAVPSEAAVTTTSTEATTAAATSSEAMMTTTEATASSSSSATAITYEIPNGGSTTIDCPSGAQCCTVGDTNLGTVTAEAGSTITFGRSGGVCYGKSGSTFDCETEPSCVLACDDAGCVVPGGTATASSTSSEAEAAAATTTTEATTTGATTTGATTTATTTVASETTPSPTAKPTPSSASAPSMVVAAAGTIAAISAFLV